MTDTNLRHKISIGLLIIVGWFALFGLWPITIWWIEWLEKVTGVKM